MNRIRAFSLIEVLIVVALLAGLAAIAIPMAIDSISERAFESAADETSEQLVMARTHAQTVGSPVEVRYHAATAQVEARLFTSWIGGIDVLGPWNSNADLTLSAKHVDAQSSRAAGPQREAEVAGPIREPWATRALTSGIRILPRQPTSQDSHSPSARTSVLAELGLPEDGDDVRLAVFMPDGTAMVHAPVWLNDQDGRLGKLTINPWTGLPEFERIEPSEAAEQDHDGAGSSGAGKSKPAKDSTKKAPSSKPNSDSSKSEP